MLTVQAITSILKLYKDQKSADFFKRYLSDQKPVQRLHDLLEDDERDLKPFEFLLPFFEDPLNIRSDSFKILESCLSADGVDAHLVYEPFIALCSAKLLSYQNYQAIKPHIHIPGLLNTIQTLCEWRLLTQARFDFLMVPQQYRKVVLALEILYTASLFSEKYVHLVQTHPTPDLFAICLKYLKYNDILTDENVRTMLEIKNITSLVKAFEKELMPAYQLNQDNFNALKNSTIPRLTAHIMVILYYNNGLDKFSLEVLTALPDPYPLWVMMCVFDKQDLINPENAYGLLKCPWLHSDEALQILATYRVSMWTQERFDALIMKANKKNPVYQVTAWLKKQNDEDALAVSSSIISDAPGDCIELDEISSVIRLN